VGVNFPYMRTLKQELLIVALAILAMAMIILSTL
jgi:hypothetical protein